MLSELIIFAFVCHDRIRHFFRRQHETIELPLAIVERERQKNSRSIAVVCLNNCATQIANSPRSILKIGLRYAHTSTGATNF